MRAVRGQLVIGVLSLTACRYDARQLSGDNLDVAPAAVEPPDMGGSGSDAVDASDARDASASESPTGDARDGAAEVVDTRAYPDWGPVSPLPLNTVAREYLAAYWRLDEGTGLFTQDATGNHNEGVFVPDPGFHPDGGAPVAGPAWRTVGFPQAGFPNNGVIFFDGVDDHVEFTPAKLPDIELPKSISLWVRYDYAVLPTDIASLFVLLSREAAGGVRLEFREGRLRVATYQTANGSPEVVGVVAPPMGWHHIVYTYDGRKHVLYVDGVEAVTTMFAFTETGKADRCRIGKSSTGVADAFKGFIDDVRVYTRDLQPTEVTRLYEGAQ